MNTNDSDPSRAIAEQATTTTTMRWETIRKRGIDSPAAGAPTKRSKHNKIDSDVKRSIQLAATKFKTFPERMMEILEKPKLDEAVVWLHEGTSFALFPYPFAARVLNVYFQGAKWESFTRKLNRWGFKRIFDDEFDPEAYIYQHPMFQKGRHDLLKHLTGSNTNSSTSSAKKKKKKEHQQEPTEGGEPKQIMASPPHHSPASYNPTAMAVMQRSLVNNLHDLSPTTLPPSFVFHPQQLMLSNPMNHNIVSSVNLLEQQQQHYLEQQRFQQQNVLLAQLQAARGRTNQQQQQQWSQLSVQELHLLRAQNADRLLRQLGQQQQQQQSSPMVPRPAPSS